MKSFPLLLTGLVALWSLTPRVSAQGDPGELIPPVSIEVDDVKPVAHVVILQPLNGTELKDPDSVELLAEATDPTGILDVVEFTANGELIGTSRIDFCPPCPNPPFCPLGPCILPPVGVTLTHRVAWERPTAGQYLLEARAQRSTGDAVISPPVAVTVLRVKQALLTLDSPAEGAVWNTPGVLPIQATAVDPDGEIRRVEFFANGKSIGVSEILTRDVEIPGRPRAHLLNWTNPPVGPQALQAKAVSDGGNEIASEIRNLTVVGDSATPVVWLESLDPTVSENVGPTDPAPRSLRFRIHRVGGTRRDLQVFLHTEGSAIPGADFAALPLSVSFPAEHRFVEVTIRPIDDDLSEGDEEVVCQLDPSPAMGPVEPYRVDPVRSRGSGIIVDDEPLFRFQEPTEAQVFVPGDPIRIRVLTISAADFVSRLEFLSSGEKIGDSVVNFILPPPPGTPVEHEFVWTGAPIAFHRLTVRTVLADGTVVESAEARNIQVSPGPDVPEVSLTVVDGVMSEGGADGPDRADVIVRRSGDNDQPLTVFVQWQGTATPGVDFTPAPTEVQVPAGQDEVHLYLTGIADDEVEGDETADLFIIHPPTLPGVLLYRTLSGASQVKLQLRDGPSISPIPMVTVRTGRPYALEGDRFNRGEFILQRTGDLTHPITASFGLSGAAIRGVDYHLVRNPCDACAAPDQIVTDNFVVIPEGESTVTLAVVAAFDGLPPKAEAYLEEVNLQVYTPPVLAVVGAKPPYIAGIPDQATVQVVERRNPNGPEVILIEPRENSILPLGVAHELRAIAVDPQGSVRWVEFLANGQGIGVSEITTEEVDVPGRLRVHSFFWTVTDPAQSGPYALSAVARSANGTEIQSGFVPVTVGGPDPMLPVVTLTGGKSPAFEQGDLKSRIGGFVLHRSGGGSLANALTVFVEVGGSATMGLDYQWFPGFDGFTVDGLGVEWLPHFGSFLPVTFAPGAAEAAVDFTAQTDSAKEGDESVSLRLIEPPFLALNAQIFPPFPAFYQIGVPREAEVIIKDAGFDLPFITLNEPVPGALIHLGQVVSLAATAARPNAGVEFIQFLVDGKVLGTVSYCCAVCDCLPAPASRAFSARLDWTPSTPGTHVLTARTAVGPDLMLESDPITVVVTDAKPGSLVIVSPPEGSVVPVGKGIIIDTIGQDPESLVSTVEFFANGEKIGESCYLCLVDAIFPPGTPLHNQIEWTPATAGTYLLTAVGQFGQNRRIESAPVTVVVGPVEAGISWVTPPEGASFSFGAPILLEVRAVDPTGIFWEVEFFDGEVRIGTSEFFCPTCRPAPGAVIPHTLEWIGAGVGPHLLTVRATRADGTVVTSPPRMITVTSDPNSDSFVTRDLPDRYEIDTPFAVQLVVRPNPSVAAYVVEEQPPFALPAPGIPGFEGPYWRVGAISHDGVFDPLTGKVKFGPFFDSEVRTLTYEVVPNVVVQVAFFDGVGVADGKTSAISGDRELRGTSRHPADRDPADDSLNATELTAYAAAWRREQLWPVGPNPIPMDFVTRAAVLWKGGESYRFDSAAGAPPFCWVNGGNPVPVVGRAAVAAALAGIALREVSPRSDGSLRVVLRVTPAPGARAFAIEEHLPTQAVVSGITGGGESTAGSRIVRWGPFFAGDSLVFSYEVSGAAIDAGWVGLISFDGQSIPIRDASPGLDEVPARVVGVDALNDGSHQVCLVAASLKGGAEYELQVSSDLKIWTPMGTFSPGEDAGFARDTGAVGAPVRFYRAIRR